MVTKPITGIYAIRNVVNDKYYVGQAVDIEHRNRKERSALQRNNTKKMNKHLCASWHKYGENNFDFLVLEECSIDELNQNEQKWIDFLKTGHEVYNMVVVVGSPMKYRKHTEEAKKKIGDRFRGIKLSPEHIAKMAASQTGKKRSPEACANISAAKTGEKNHNFGKKFSDEHRAKMSASMSAAKKGKPWTPTQRQAQMEARNKKKGLTNE